MPAYTFKGPDGAPYTVNAPDGMSEGTAYEKFRAYWQQQGTQRQPLTEGQKRAQANDRAAEGARVAAEDLSPLEKILVNLGAGTDTLVQGAKGLVGRGGSDAEIEQKRARDAALAQSTDMGILPDGMWTGGDLAQFAGETLPTAVVGPGMFARGAMAAGRGVGTVARAVAGAQPAARAAAGVGRMGTGMAVADAGLAGGALGALQPVTSDESRTFNATVGALGGVLLPGLVAGARTVKDFLTRGGAEKRAIERLIQEVGGPDEAQKVIDQIASRKAHPAVADVPLTTAEVTANPALGVAERRNAPRDAANWETFRRGQRQARYDALTDITHGADELESRIATRDKTTKPLRERALAEAGKDPWFQSPVAARVQQILGGDSGANPSVQRMARYVMGELDNGITPGRLYEVRKVLENGLHDPVSIADDPLKSAIKGADRQTLAVMDAIDEALQKSSGGRWKDVNQPLNQRLYMNEYSRLSGPVDDARASAQLRDRFETGARTEGLAGTVPEVTEHRLRTGMNKVGENAYGDRWSVGTRDALDALRENVGRSDILQKAIKNAGTTGGGSNTPMDIMTENRLGRVAQVLHFASKRARTMEEAALGDALRNPTVFVRGVEKKLAANKPLTEAEWFVLQTIRGSGSGLALEALGQ